MKTYADFRTWFIGALFALLISVSGYALAAQAEAAKEMSKELAKHAERIAKLEAIAETQRDINKELKEIVRSLSERR